MDIQELAQKISIENLDKLNKKEVKQYTLLNKEFHKSLRKIFIDLNCFKNHGAYDYIYVINSLNYSLETFEDLQIFIKKFLTNKKRDVSFEKLTLISKINEKILPQIIKFTNNYPSDIVNVVRCSMIIQNIKTFPTCLHCGIKPVYYFQSKIGIYCSKECAYNSDGRAQKTFDTKLKLYNNGHYTNTEKSKVTIINKYGVNHISHIPGFADKVKQTKLENFGDENYNNREQAKETCIEKYGVENVLQLKETQNKINITKLKTLSSFKIMNISEIVDIILKNKLYNFSQKKFNKYKKQNPEFKFNFLRHRKNFMFGHNNYDIDIIKLFYSISYKIQTFDEVKLFINTFIINGKNHIHENVLNFFTEKFRLDLKDKILEMTKNFPNKISMVGRSLLISKNIKEFPKCLTCEKNPVSWSNSSKLGIYCSKKCADASCVKHNKSKITNIERYGVENVMHNQNIFERSQKNGFKMYKYKDTSLNYQGKYELYFLELMENAGLLNEIKRGPSFKYKWENKITTYYSDFLFKERIIEIKSVWTYDSKGKDIKKGLKNEAKWQSVRECGMEIDIIIDDDKKIKILEYVTTIAQTLNKNSEVKS